MASKKTPPEPAPEPKRKRGRPRKFADGPTQITLRLAPVVADALARFASYERGVTGKAISTGDAVTAALSTHPPFLAFLKKAALLQGFFGAFRIVK